MKNIISNILPFAALFLILFYASCVAQSKEKMELKIIKQEQGNAVKWDKESGNMVMYIFDSCFWCVEGVADIMPGVVNAVSGYGGGLTKNPTYQNHGDHAEGVKVTYDPKVVSYKELVDYYFLVHSFGKSPDTGHSYRAIIWSRKGDVGHVKKAYANAVKVNGAPFQQEVIVGEINWTDAEPYHQNYIKRLEAGEKVVNRGYGLGESIPRRNRALKLIKNKN